MPIGARGHIGIKKELIWGQKVAGNNDFFLPFVSETLTANIEEILSNAQRAIADEPASYPGERSFFGDIIIEVHPASIGHLLRSAINEPEAAVPAGTAELVLEDCEDAWNEKIDIGVISGIDATYKKKGNYSVKIQVTTGVVADTILATEVVSLTDMHLDTHIKLWVKSSVDCAEGDLVFMISEVAECGGVEGTTLKSVDIPALVAGVEKECTIALGTMTNFDAIISLGIKMHTDKGEFIVNIDDVRRIVTAAASTAKQHIFIPRQANDFHADCPINPYTLEVYRDQGDAFQFLGAIFNTLALNFSTTDKILKASNGIIAKNSGDTPKTAPSLETTNPFTWEQAIISIAESPNNDIESFGINYDNKCVGKYTLNNTVILRKIIRDGFRNIPVNFTIDFVDRTEYNKFIAGEEQAFQVKFIGAECETGYYYTLQIDIPKLRYLTYPVNISGPGPIVCGVTGKAKYDASLGYPVKFTLINLETEY
jgi:hypothetical protein